jgi:hypothetical protein
MARKFGLVSRPYLFFGFIHSAVMIPSPVGLLSDVSFIYFLNAALAGTPHYTRDGSHLDHIAIL